MVEEALPWSYGKRVVLRLPEKPQPIAYRVGPLARLNCADRMGTPLADEYLARFKETWKPPCHDPVLGHYARLIELLHCAERAHQIAQDEEILSPNVRATLTGTPRRAVAHVEDPRGVLIHDFDVDKNGIVQAANFVVATQHNIAAINDTIRLAAEKLLSQGDDAMLDGVEFAIRCYDPCLSCSTHQVGQMPLEITVHQGNALLRRVRR